MFDKYATKEDFLKAMEETEKKLQKLEKDLEKIKKCFNDKSMFSDNLENIILDDLSEEDTEKIKKKKVKRRTYKSTYSSPKKKGEK